MPCRVQDNTNTELVGVDRRIAGEVVVNALAKAFLLPVDAHSAANGLASHDQ
jgi:hypothetical protein